MQQIIYRNLQEYIEDAKIQIIDDLHVENDIFLKTINEEDVERQLYLISEFHKKMMGCDEYVLERIASNTGKIVEQYKVELKKVRRDLRKIREKGINSNFEKILLTEGEQIIAKGERCIDSIYFGGYTDLIVRSMDNKEICLGDVYFSNLRLKESKIQIKNIKKIKYNMVEVDGFNLLNKLKKKELNLDWGKLVRAFCYFENLEKNSENFISGLLNYPYEFVKCCSRYRKKKKWSSEKYENKLKKIIIKERENII
ncbi:hypothetical protein ACFIJ5_15825 [Haloimpatiens sp. FM7330]|uniref:hypothetical protein n=1 Tax=Haloimpatiens sp. FM7330 TaxID=3298610 RepID=UPI00363F7BE9